MITFGLLLSLKCGRVRRASVRTRIRLSIKTFVLVCERRFRGISGRSDRDDIDAVKIVAMPFFRHHSRVAAMSR
jgi:hypothetical protein